MPFGHDRSTISLRAPSGLGRVSNGDTCNLENGDYLKGPAIALCFISVDKYSCTAFGNCIAEA